MSESKYKNYDVKDVYVIQSKMFNDSYVSNLDYYMLRENVLLVTYDIKTS